MDASELTLEAKDLNQQAFILLRAGHVEQAIEKLEQAIDLDPMVMDSYKNYGELYMHIEDYTKALAMFKKALLIEKSGELYFACGNACFMNQDPQRGLEYYNLALGAGYDTDDVLFFMGLAYEHTGDSAMALRYFQKACVKSPARFEFHVKKIRVLIGLSMFEEATVALDTLQKVAPELYESYHLRVHLLTRMGHMEEATQVALSATQRFPEDAALMLDYVRCLALEGKYDLAQQNLEQGKKLKYFEHVKTDFLRLEGQLAAERGEFDHAIACVEECITQTPPDGFDSESHFLLVNLQMAQRNFQAVFDYASKLVERKLGNDHYYAALYYRALSAKELGREDAPQLYKNAIFIYRGRTLDKPDAIDLYIYRCMCLKDTEQYEKGLDLLEFVEHLTNKVAELYALRAEIYRLMGRTALVEPELEKAFALKPQLRPLTNGEEA